MIPISRFLLLVSVSYLSNVACYLPRTVIERCVILLNKKNSFSHLSSALLGPR